MGLSMKVDQMEEYSQGRVWTGKDAVSRGLVDAVGGFSRAVAIAKQKAKIPAHKQVSNWILLVVLKIETTTPFDVVFLSGARLIKTQLSLSVQVHVEKKFFIFIQIMALTIEWSFTIHQGKVHQ